MYGRVGDIAFDRENGKVAVVLLFPRLHSYTTSFPFRLG